MNGREVTTWPFFVPWAAGRSSSPGPSVHIFALPPPAYRKARFHRAARHAVGQEQASASGLEEVLFLVSGHPGSTPRPVGKVASGGELSRIALAIAVTTSQLGSAGTLIFDEVDSGVGGAVAETVGRLMKQLGRDRQVLAVTHLPQVAACADHHWVVSKHQADQQTVSQVTTVQGEHRVSEIARMLGGERLSDTTLAHAREMLGTPVSSPKAARS